MPLTRSYENPNTVTEWTEEINEVPNQFGLLNGMGLFNSVGVSTTTITFDRTEHNITLLPQTKRGHRNGTTGDDKKVETFALPIPFFKHDEFITADDIQNYRQPGTAVQDEALGRVIAEKLMLIRERADQTSEYMKIQAIKGRTIDPSGVELFNGFTEFGTPQVEIDMDLGTGGTDIDNKITEIKRTVAKNAKTGTRVGNILCLVGPVFYDKLITHVALRDAYKHYINSGKQHLRDDLTTYRDWGITEVFEHRGITFVSYDAEFLLPGESTQAAFEYDTALGPNTLDVTGGEGYTIVSGVNGAYRGVNGPSDKLTGANQVGQEMFVFEYRDQRDENHLVQLEMAPLYWLAKPQVSVLLYSST